MTTTIARTSRPHGRLSRDPWMLGSLLVLAGAVAWALVPLATGATVGPVSSDTRIDLEAPIVTSVTPAWTSGEAATFDALTESGDKQDTFSSGWEMTTNWRLGFEVRVRSTTSPALRGANAVDGRGAESSFQDFTQGACPCGWSLAGFDRGVFGYSMAVRTVSGAPARDTAKWSSAGTRRWRGLSREPYRAYYTDGGVGTYEMTMFLRTEIPDEAVQREGSYRANVVVSSHALM